MQLACQIAAAHELEDVADSIIVNLSKIPLQQLAQVQLPCALSDLHAFLGCKAYATPAMQPTLGSAVTPCFQVPANARADVAFGKDHKLPAVTRTLATIINK